MTRTKKQILPALHKSNKVQNPDMPSVEQQNYTSTVLKYANLALPFPQLDTKAKRVVPAINELWHNRVIANPPLPGGGPYEIVSEDGYIIVSQDDYIITSDGEGDVDDLTSIQIDGVIYKIVGSGGATSLDELTDVTIMNPEDGQVLRYDSATDSWVNVDGGSDYTAGAGIYFTGENNSVINADAGRFSPVYNEYSFSTDYASDYRGYWEACWVDSGTTVEGNTVYQSYAGTYKLASGNSICTFTVGGYDRFTVYAKQNPETSGLHYIVFGNLNQDIDLEHEQYNRSCKDRDDSDYISNEYYLGGGKGTVEIMYHKDPYEPGVSLNLNDGQFVDTGTTVDGHPVYKSDAGSYHISNGTSTCTLNFSGVASITIYFRSSSESGYDWAYVGSLDYEVSKYYYKSRLSGDVGYSAVTYECSGGPHYIQVMYGKDGSVDSNDDRAYFYYVINEYAPAPPDDEQALVYVALGEPLEPHGEIFNDYDNNRAVGYNTHAEGYNTKALGYGAHAEGYSTLASGSYSHAEGYESITNGSGSHAEGGQTKAIGEKSHAEGAWTTAGAAYSHAEGNSNETRGEGAHAEGYGTSARGPNSHTEGRETVAIGYRGHAEGYKSLAQGTTSHAEGWNTQALSGQDHAEGYYAVASGGTSHAEGMDTIASGGVSHAEGQHTEAQGTDSHSEGYYTIASGNGSHSEGYGDSTNPNTASGVGAHAEGGITKATGNFSHAEGYYNTASGLGAHAEGFGSFTGANVASGISSHAEGGGNTVSGNCGHAEGTRNTVYSESGHADGSGNRVYGRESHASGSGNLVSEQSGYIEGAGNRNIAFGAHVEGLGNSITYKSTGSHTEGAGNRNYGQQSHIEGSGNVVSGEESHVEGAGNMGHGPKTHVEGGGNIAYSLGGHVEGKHNTIVGYAQHAEGTDNIIGYSGTPGYFAYGTNYAVGDIVGVNNVYTDYVWPETDNKYLYRCITAPGQIQASSNISIITPAIWDSSTTYASGAVVQLSEVGFYYNASSESVTGIMPTTGWPWNRITSILSPFKSSGSGYYMLDCNEVNGVNLIAIVSSGTVPAMWEPIDTSSYGHIEGLGNISTGNYQHVQGKFNADDSTKAFIIGNGTDATHRSNAATMDWSGNMTIAGDLTTGVQLSTTAQTIAGAINEIVSGGGATIDYIPDAFIDSLFE